MDKLGMHDFEPMGTMPRQRAQPPQSLPPTYDETVSSRTMPHRRHDIADPSRAPSLPRRPVEVIHMTPAPRVTLRPVETVALRPVEPIYQPIPVYMNSISTQAPARELDTAPQYVACPHCGSAAMTRTELKANAHTHLVAALICLVLLGCFVWVPYCMRSCKSTKHYCRNCDSLIGEHSGDC